MFWWALVMMDGFLLMAIGLMNNIDFLGLAGAGLVVVSVARFYWAFYQMGQRRQ